MCNCLTETAERLKKHLADPAQTIPASMRPPKADPGEPQFLLPSNGAFIFGESGGLKSVLSIPYTATWRVGEKRKETRINITASHCPFCGQPFEDAEDMAAELAGEGRGR